jgi:hypothetical protein
MPWSPTRDLRASPGSRPQGAPKVPRRRSAVAVRSWPMPPRTCWERRRPNLTRCVFDGYGTRFLILPGERFLPEEFSWILSGSRDGDQTATRRPALRNTVLPSCSGSIGAVQVARDTPTGVSGHRKQLSRNPFRIRIWISCRGYGDLVSWVFYGRSSALRRERRVSPTPRGGRSPGAAGPPGCVRKH